MASLTGKTVGSTYKDLLTVAGATGNEGLETTLKNIVDGEGTESAVQISTTTLKIPTGKTLDVAGDTTVESIEIGGGYGSTGVTINNSGDILMNGNGTVVGNWKVQGTVIADNGKMKKAASGGGKTGITIADDNVIALTVEKESVDVELLKIDNNGVLIIKDDLGDSKFSIDTNGGLALKSGFEAKSTGTVKFKSHTTSELNAITGTAGEIAYDSQTGKFRIWKS